MLRRCNQSFPGTDFILSPHFQWHEQGCAQTVCDTLQPVMLGVGALHCTVMSQKGVCF